MVFNKIIKDNMKNLQIKPKDLINEKCFFINKENTLMFDGETELKVSKNIRSQNKRLDDFGEDERFSLFQLSKISKDVEYELSEAELFGQIVLQNYIYYGFEMEKRIKTGEKHKNDRYDLSKSYHSGQESKPYIQIELKKANKKEIQGIRQGVYSKAIDEARKETLGYWENYYSDETNLKPQDKIIMGIIIIDGNHYFNNIFDITTLHSEMTIDAETSTMVYTENYIFSKEQSSALKYSNKQMEVHKISSGIVSSIEVGDHGYYEDKNSVGDVSYISAHATPSNLMKLATDTNVRDLNEGLTSTIRDKIENDMRKERDILEYRATAMATLPKALSAKEKVYILNQGSSESRTKIVLGVNIDQFNGQHSTRAYHDIFIAKSELESEIAGISNMQEEQLLLPIQIYPYKNQIDLEKKRHNSNFSPKKPDEYAANLHQILSRTNKYLYKIGMRDGQICRLVAHTKARNINGCDYQSSSIFLIC